MIENYKRFSLGYTLQRYHHDISIVVSHRTRGTYSSHKSNIIHLTQTATVCTKAEDRCLNASLIARRTSSLNITISSSSSPSSKSTKKVSAYHPSKSVYLAHNRDSANYFRTAIASVISKQTTSACFALSHHQ